MDLLLLLALLTPSEELRQLRETKGHWQGDSFNQSVDAWGGRKHQLLEELHQQLQTASEPTVRATLGEPDREEPNQGPLHELVLAPPGTRLLVYEWRGMHDFLYFVTDGQKVVTSGWWLAYE